MHGATIKIINVSRFVVLTVVLIMLQIFWNLTQCVPVNSYEHIRGTWYLITVARKVATLYLNLFY